MKNYKKILAGVLATSMVLGNSAVVFADEGGQAKGSGKVEGQVKTEVFSVVLPTEDSYTGTFDYIIDPLQLIKNDAGNNGNKYDKTKFDFDANSTVFFYNGVTGGKATYTNTSNALKVENKSSMPVDIAITLRASEVEGITFTNDDTFTTTNPGDSTDTSLYLAIEGKGHTVDEASTPNVGDVTSLDKTEKVNSNGIIKLDGVQLAALAPTNTGGTDKAFVTQWNPIRNTYEFVANTAVDKTTTYYEFKLKGQCNPNEDAEWLDILAAGETPELEIMWSIEDPTGAQVALDEANQKITISDLTPEQGYASLTFSDGKETYDVGGSSDSTWDDSGWDAETSSGTIVITYADWWKEWMADKLMTLTLTLTDGSTRTETFIAASMP